MMKERSKERKLKRIHKNCTKLIGSIYRSRKTIVQGDGNYNAQIMLVCTSPDEWESAQRRLFVGARGLWLRRLLDKLGLEREEVYLSSLVRFRPCRLETNGRLADRLPDKEELALFLPFLLQEIHEIEPTILIAMGETVVRALTGEKDVLRYFAQPQIVEIAGVPVSLCMLAHDGAVYEELPQSVTVGLIETLQHGRD